MKVYKVVSRRADGRRLSAIIRGEACVEYVPGRPTKARCKGTPLFAFKDERAAHAWNGGSYRIDGKEIWRCSARTSSRGFMRVMGIGLLDTFCSEIAKWWRRKPWGGNAPPAGAVLCTEITLEEKIHA